MCAVVCSVSVKILSREKPEAMLCSARKQQSHLHKMTLSTFRLIGSELRIHDLLIQTFV